MSDHTELIPMTDDEVITPGFDLVRRGYDPHQVDAHVGWLEARLREAESQRAAAEAAAAEARGVAAQAREELAAGRPAWETFGGRITEILELAEKEGAEIRQRRTREADQLHEEARRLRDDVGRAYAEKVREGEQRAGELVRSAEAEVERLVREAKLAAAQEQREAERRLADLARQRDQVHVQLTRLRDGLAAAVAPLDPVRQDPARPQEEAGRPQRPQRPLGQ